MKTLGNRDQVDLPDWVAINLGSNQSQTAGHATNTGNK
jgi:hypothetical protein